MVERVHAERLTYCKIEKMVLLLPLYWYLCHDWYTCLVVWIQSYCKSCLLCEIFVMRVQLNSNMPFSFNRVLEVVVVAITQTLKQPQLLSLKLRQLLLLMLLLLRPLLLFLLLPLLRIKTSDNLSLHSYSLPF